MKIAITTSSFAKFSEEPLDLLRKAGIGYVLNPHGRKLTEDETIELLQGCVAVAAGTEPLTARVMDALPELKIISRCGTGMDNVDMSAAKERGIAVRNTPDGPTQAVVELTLGLALDLMRQVTRMDRELRSGVWRKRMGNLLTGKRLGIIGFGRIGRAVADAFAPLGVEVAFNDPVATCTDFRCMPVEELLGWADILSLHCSRAGGECSYYTEEHLRAMKRGSWVLNVARGGIIDEQALYNVLADGHLAGAAIDVFEKEPYTGPLATLDNVILTPHIGSYAMEARIRMETDTIANLIDALSAAQKG
ncbi:phosphoglycerate dehydrogenase [Oleidesulfovibrio sp.]|uniref:phosphoglycerate dehydrogenase n=1 Tax=Oleidesulfovibrio sp. TaxID=2909707 RepID=UPI003A83554D